MLRESNKIPKYIFDPFSKKPYFKNKSIFSNSTIDFKKFVKNSKFFYVCIAREDGFARYKISKELEKLKLKPINIKSKLSYIHKETAVGEGLIAMPKSYVNRGVKLGEYCINTGAIIDHECNREWCTYHGWQLLSWTSKGWGFFIHRQLQQYYLI